jgi:hypothetical protein
MQNIFVAALWVLTLRIATHNINHKLRGLNPQANYTDQATAVCW